MIRFEFEFVYIYEKPTEFSLCSGALVIWAFNAGLTSTLTVSNFAYPITKLEDIVKE